MYKYFISLSIVFILLGCRKFVTDDFTDPLEQYVLNARLSPSDTIVLHISKNGNISAAQLNVVNDETVELYENDTLLQTLSHGKEGIYTFSYTPHVGKRYTFKLPNSRPVVQATTLIPEPASLENVTFIPSYGIDEEGFVYGGIEMDITARSNETDYFNLRMISESIQLQYDENGNPLFINGRPLFDTIIEAQMFHSFYEDPVFDIEELDIPVCTNVLMKERPYHMSLSYLTNSMGSGLINGSLVPRYSYDPFYVELRTITQEYYTYLKALELYERGRYEVGLTVDNEPVNLYSNVENGLGAVLGFSGVTSKKIDPQ